MINNLKRIYRYLFKNPPRVRCDRRLSVERHGSVYGGWNILKDSLDQNSIIISAGVGNDATFDLSLIDKYKCNVLAFDPTPAVQSWVHKQSFPDQFIFVPKGISAESGMLTLYAPKEVDHISHSMTPTGNSTTIDVPCLSLVDLVSAHVKDRVPIDLLKMDIEGAEYGVIEKMDGHEIRPKQLLVEFHHFFDSFTNKDTEQAIEKLRAMGYELFAISDSFCEYSFCLSE